MSSTPPSPATPAAEPPVDDTSVAGTAGADTPVEVSAEPAEVPAEAPAGVPQEKPAKAPGMSPAACAQELRQRFPALFDGPPKPLKLRTHVDIEARAPGVFSKQVLTAFFRRYTGSTSYLLSVARGRQRFDLDGKPGGEISDEHRQIAVDELTRRGVGLQSRRELEEQQRRNRAGLLFDYERTTLTRANFCVLKQVAEEELDGLLEIARAEAAQDQQRRPPPDARPQGRPPGQRRDGPPQGQERPPGPRGRGPRNDEGRRR
jgi:ProP effector